MSQVFTFVQSGWPGRAVEKAIKPYFSLKDEITLYERFLLWGQRVIITERKKNNTKRATRHALRFL